MACDDGVPIAKELASEEAVGDGTTTSTLLAHALFAEGHRNVVADATMTEKPTKDKDAPEPELV